MTSVTSAIDDINRIPVKGSKRELPEFYKPVLEQYKIYLESLELTPLAKNERIFRCRLALIKVHGLFGNRLLDLTEEEVTEVKNSITEYSDSHVRKTVKVLCDMMRYFGFTDWYSRIYRTITPETPWAKGRKGEFLFEHELRQYRNAMEVKGLREETIRKDCGRIRTMCSVLNKELGITGLEEIDERCFAVLRELMVSLTDGVRQDNIEILKRFLRESIGRDFYAEERERELLASLPAGSETESFLSELEDFLRVQHCRGLCNESIDNIRHCATIAYTVLTQRFGRLHPGDITKEMMWEVRDSFSVKDNTVKTYLSALGRMIDYFHGRNPFHEANMLWSNEEFDRTFIDRGQWKILLNNADRIQRMILVLAASLGLRRSEIARLKLSDYDGYRITVNGKGTGRHGKLVKLTVDDLLKQEIESYLDYRQEIMEGCNDLTDGSFIVKITGTRILPATRNRVSRMMEQLSEKTGITFACHTLRRFFANCLIDDGVPLEVVKSMMRHSDVKTTMIYLEDNKKRKMEAYRRHNGLILG